MFSKNVIREDENLVHNGIANVRKFTEEHAHKDKNRAPHALTQVVREERMCVYKGKRGKGGRGGGP